jgi:hypothetical protein
MLLYGDNLFLRRALLAQAGGFQPELGTQGEKIGYYTKELARLVYQRYKADVELLGYREAYQELMNGGCYHNDNQESRE